MAHHVVDVGTLARRDDPHAAALCPELLAELPQRTVECHEVEVTGVEFDLAPPQPVDLRGIVDADRPQEFGAAHPEVAGGVLLFGHCVARFAQRFDIGAGIGAARIDERTVEIQKNQSNARHDLKR